MTIKHVSNTHPSDEIIHPKHIQKMWMVPGLGKRGKAWNPWVACRNVFGKPQADRSGDRSTSYGYLLGSKLVVPCKLRRKNWGHSVQ